MYASARPITLPAPSTSAPPELPGENSGIGLDEVDERLRLTRRTGDRPTEPRDHTCGHAVREAERAPDRDARSPSAGSGCSNDAAGSPVRVTLTAATSVTGSVATTVPLARLPSANTTVTGLGRADDVRVGRDVSVSRPDHPAAEAIGGFDRDDRSGHALATCGTFAQSFSSPADPPVLVVADEFVVVLVADDELASLPLEQLARARANTMAAPRPEPNAVVAEVSSSCRLHDSPTRYSVLNL